MEQMIMIMLQTCQVYSEKMERQPLAEYEVLLYEQLCNMVATFAKVQDVIGRVQLMELHKVEIAKQLELDQWQKDHDESLNQKDRKPLPEDEGVDPSSRYSS